MEVAAICDVNRTTLDRVSERFPKARKQVDLRRLVEDLKDIDAVVVSTTEHSHAFATLPALQQRKPVYCEKPLTYNIQEAKRIMQEAAQADVATQMGTQIHATPQLPSCGRTDSIRGYWTSLRSSRLDLASLGLQSQEDAQRMATLFM